MIQPLLSYPDKTIEKENEPNVEQEHKQSISNSNMDLDVIDKQQMLITTNEVTQEKIKTIEEDLDDFFKSIGDEKKVVKRSVSN